MSPANILQSDVPYLWSGELHCSAGEDDDLCDVGSILLAAKEGEVRAVMSDTPLLLGRGVMALHMEAEEDRFWLLHDLRLRKSELTAAAQGAGGRELSRRALASTAVRWPSQAVRTRFARIAKPLHLRARSAQAENRTLDALRGALLISFLSGKLWADSVSAAS
ncbi:restriction endonuclease subunit S domain-containing protein [Streptomyces rimosus]|uniref:hypothetical protein n=1 Tax=Streptomyces rimosus TaxID=1927 RepID=UPI00131C5CAD|nr:hypothetical protein [Streptomyces rimosus]